MKQKIAYISARCNAPDGLGDCDIYTAEVLEDGTWGNIQHLGPHVNSRGWDSHPMLSATEDTLYFASDRPGGFGLSDIYFSYKTPKGDWAPSQNLGPMINSRNSEVSPFIHPNRNILYFSSNGQLYNFGAFDIYKSIRKGKVWSEPVNIGPLVNGTGNEHYFTIDAEFSHIYYAKSTSSDINSQDIYSFPLPMEAHPDAVISLRGSLLEEDTNQPLEGIVSVIDLDQGIEIAPKFLSEDGKFEFQLIDNKNYLLVIQGKDFARIEELFYLSGEKEIRKKTRLKSKHKEEPRLFRRIEFKSIEFEKGSAEILPGMHEDLDKVANFLAENTSYLLNISGHTDAVGDPTFNLKLSTKRAESIAYYIQKIRQIDANRIKHKGYGSSQPIRKEETEEDRSMNRRVEFYIFLPKQ